MIYKETYLKVCENSGATEVKCIGTLNKKYSTLSDKIVVSIQKINNTINNQKKIPLSKGQVYRAIIINLTKKYTRPNGFSFSFNSNGCVLLDSKGSPLFTRISTAVPYEIRKAGHLKVFALAKVIV